MARSRRWAIGRAARLHAGTTVSGPRTSTLRARLAATKTGDGARPAGRGAAGGAGPVAWAQRPPAPTATSRSPHAASAAAAPRGAIGASAVDWAATRGTAATASLAAEFT